MVAITACNIEPASVVELATVEVGLAPVVVGLVTVVGLVPVVVGLAPVYMAGGRII